MFSAVGYPFYTPRFSVESLGSNVGNLFDFSAQHSVARMHTRREGYAYGQRGHLAYCNTKTSVSVLYSSQVTKAIVLR